MRPTLQVCPSCEGRGKVVATYPDGPVGSRESVPDSERTCRECRGTRRVPTAEGNAVLGIIAWQWEYEASGRTE